MGGGNGVEEGEAGEDEGLEDECAAWVLLVRVAWLIIVLGELEGCRSFD